MTEFSGVDVDNAKFYDDEELAALQALPAAYKPDDFAWQERRESGAASYPEGCAPRHQRGKPLNFDLSLEQLRGRLDPTGEKLGQTERLRRAWEVVAGPSVASHSRNLFLHGNELVVWLDSNLYAQELPLFANEYLKGLARELGRGVVSRITYRLNSYRL